MAFGTVIGLWGGMRFVTVQTPHAELQVIRSRTARPECPASSPVRAASRQRSSSPESSDATASSPPAHDTDPSGGARGGELSRLRDAPDWRLGPAHPGSHRVAGGSGASHPACLHRQDLPSVSTPLHTPRACSAASPRCGKKGACSSWWTASAPAQWSTPTKPAGVRMGTTVKVLAWTKRWCGTGQRFLVPVAGYPSLYPKDTALAQWAAAVSALCRGQVTHPQARTAHRPGSGSCWPEPSR